MISEKYIVRAEELRMILIRLSGVDPMEKNRTRDVVTTRMMMSIVLMREGCPIKDVARLVGKNRSTVLHYKDNIQLLSFPGYEADLELWQKFNKEIGYELAGK